MDKKTLTGIVVVMAAIAISMTLTLQAFDDAIDDVRVHQKIGLVVNAPSASTDLAQIQNIYAQAASTGIGRSNVYMFWDMIEPEKSEFDWKQSDILMSLNKDNNLKVTLYFSLINGKTLGPFPDWIGKPSLLSIDDEKVADTLDAILERYHIIDTVVIAGEADGYFRYNEADISVYNELFQNVYTTIKQKHPNVQIGNVYSLHGVINKDLGHIVDALDVGDFIGFTYFPVDILNDIVKTPDEAIHDLGYALEIANGTQIAFFEIGWSTSDFVNGNEADQATFVANTFQFYNENKADIEFLTWYRQYDKPVGSCAFAMTPQANDVSISSGSGFGGNEHIIERLDNYLCGSGFIDVDGNPKPGWAKLVDGIADMP